MHRPGLAVGFGRGQTQCGQVLQDGGSPGEARSNPGTHGESLPRSPGRDLRRWRSGKESGPEKDRVVQRGYPNPGAKASSGH